MKHTLSAIPKYMITRVLFVLLLSMLCHPAFGQAFPSSAAFQAAFLKPAAAGGPDAWYDAIAQASTTDDNAGNTTIMLWSKVSVAVSGTATKLRVYTGNGGAFVSGDLKAALYTSGGVLMDSATITVTAENQYQELTLDDGDTVTAGDYWIAWQPDAVLSTAWRYATGFTSGDTKFAANSYAAFPPANLPSGTDLDWHMAVGVYVD